MGQLFFPLRRPHPRGGGCQRRIRRDVPQRGCTHCPAAPVRTAAVPDVFCEGGCVFGRLAQLFFLRAASSRLTPSPPQACVLSGGPGDPGRSRGAAHPVHPRSARAGPAAVRTALPCPVASSCAPIDVHQSHPCLLHAAIGSTRARAGRPAVRPLLSSNAGLCFHRAGRLQKPFRPMQRVHPDRYRTGIRVSAVQLCVYPRDIRQMSTRHTGPRRAAGSLS